MVLAIPAGRVMIIRRGRSTFNLTDAGFEVGCNPSEVHVTIPGMPSVVYEFLQSIVETTNWTDVRVVGWEYMASDGRVVEVMNR